VCEEPRLPKLIFYWCSRVTDASYLAVSAAICITARLGIFPVAFRTHFLGIVGVTPAVVVALTALIRDSSRAAASTDAAASVTSALRTRNRVECRTAPANRKSFLRLNVANSVKWNVDALLI
jgi:hypothetical protein